MVWRDAVRDLCCSAGNQNMENKNSRGFVLAVSTFLVVRRDSDFCLYCLGRYHQTDRALAIVFELWFEHFSCTVFGLREACL